jgi:predicted Zn-ribbon and HTH transcriptional regulator
MPRALPSAVQSALAARQLVARDFLWIVARTRATPPVAAPVGFWSDVGNVAAPVTNPDTGLAETRAFYGSGTLISMTDVMLVSNITVQTVRITMSQIDEMVSEAIRVYEVKQARVEIYRGLYDPETRALVAPAFCRFVGFVDRAEIKTPTAGAAGAALLTCTSHTQEMLRSNPDTRSHQSQLRRDPTDTFFLGAEQASEIEIFWGKANGKIPTQTGGFSRQVGMFG